tara:strand:+ start:58 stop:348 length:291 start_codon:yes stop_codon:yes gene_type:complete
MSKASRYEPEARGPRYSLTDEGREALDAMRNPPACVLCGESIEANARDPRWTLGANPAPLADEGKCCDICDLTRVLPARLELMYPPARAAQRLDAT